MIGFRSFVKESLQFSYIGTPATTVGDSVVDTIMNGDKLNGVAKTMTARQIAKKHKVPFAQISSQLRQGQKIEKEHTKDKNTALKIAMDHVFEKPDYYTKLKKYVESKNICWKGYKRVRGTKRYEKGSCEKISESKQRIKDPKGGLTAYGRKYFNRKEGSNLKPGVKKIKSSTDARRRGSFLVRHYGGPAKPLKDDKGRPTRHALQACLFKDSRITLLDGTTKTIEEIVENELNIDILSINPDTLKLEPAKIIGWSKTESDINEFISIGNSNVCETPSGHFIDLKLTKDHRILTTDGWVESINSLGKKSYVLTLTPNDIMLQYIYGTMLGDSCINKSENWREGACLSGSNCESQIDLVEQKCKMLKVSPGSIYISNNLNKQPTHPYITNSLPFYKKLKSDWTSSSFRKGLPDNLESIFSDLTLAVWIMDDGSLHSNKEKTTFNYRIHTEGFTKLEVQRLINMLNSKYNINSTFYKRENCDGYVINICKKNDVNLISSVISKFIPPGLKYKVLPQHREVDYTDVSPESKYNYDVYESPIKYIKIAEYGTNAHTKISDYDFKYDISLDRNHAFFANGRVVHNSAWGQPVPRTQEDARRLAAKGRKLLDKFKKLKEEAPANNAGSGNISGLKASDLPGRFPMKFIKRFKNKMQKYEVPVLNVKGSSWAGKGGGFGASGVR